MEKLTNKISSKIADELKLDNDNREVIAYGIFAIFSIALSIIFVAVFGIIFHVAIEALVVCFTGSILRKYSGGVHATTPTRCVIVGVVVCVGEALFLSAISPLINRDLLIISGIVVFMAAYYFVYKLAPVDSAAKPIKKKEKIIRMKKSSIFILNAYVVIVIVNIILYMHFKDKRFSTYSLCIYGGTVWQIFTLTKFGHGVMNKVDAFFNQILKFIKGVK